MEATLLQFVLNVTHILLLQVAEHFGKDKFQRIGTHILHGATIRIFYLKEAFVAEIKGSAEHVYRISGRITIYSTKTLYIVLCSQHGCYNDLIRIQTLTFQRVKKISSNTIK